MFLRSDFGGYHLGCGRLLRFSAHAGNLLATLDLTGAQTAGRERSLARHCPFGAGHPAKQASSESALVLPTRASLIKVVRFRACGLCSSTPYRVA
jgi:hypothetical protein